jgi:hypothetical protein
VSVFIAPLRFGTRTILVALGRSVFLESAGAAHLVKCTAPFLDAKRGGLNLRTETKWPVSAHSTPEPCAGRPYEAGDCGGSTALPQTSAGAEEPSVPD